VKPTASGPTVPSNIISYLKFIIGKVTEPVKIPQHSLNIIQRRQSEATMHKKSISYHKKDISQYTKLTGHKQIPNIILSIAFSCFLTNSLIFQ
jgi:hypothetical protein